MIMPRLICEVECTTPEQVSKLVTAFQNAVTACIGEDVAITITLDARGREK